MEGVRGRSLGTPARPAELTALGGNTKSAMGVESTLFVLSSALGFFVWAVHVLHSVPLSSLRTKHALSNDNAHTVICTQNARITELVRSHSPLSMSSYLPEP